MKTTQTLEKPNQTPEKTTTKPTTKQIAAVGEGAVLSSFNLSSANKPEERIREINAQRLGAAMRAEDPDSLEEKFKSVTPLDIIRDINDPLANPRGTRRSMFGFSKKPKK